jgi:hypothetical protein
MPARAGRKRIQNRKERREPVLDPVPELLPKRKARNWPRAIHKTPLS